MLFVGTSIIHPSTEGVFLLCNILDLLIYSYQRQIEELGDFVLSRTKIPEDIFNENFENDWYLSAKEAIKYGVADKIITSLDEII